MPLFYSSCKYKRIYCTYVHTNQCVLFICYILYCIFIYIMFEHITMYMEKLFWKENIEIKEKQFVCWLNLLLFFFSIPIYIHVHKIPNIYIYEYEIIFLLGLLLVNICECVLASYITMNRNKKPHHTSHHKKYKSILFEIHAISWDIIFQK